MSEIKSLQDRLDAVYHERNQLAIALARLVLIHDDLKFSDLAGYGFDPATGRAVVYVTLPSGAQVSWHMSDRITRDWQVNGCTSLPTFSGKWDGTFVGREEGWPAKHIRSEPHPNPLYAIKVGIGADGRSYARGFGAAIAADAAAYITKSYGVDCDPLGATHYRTCTGGNRRFYRKVDGTWLYFHNHDESWHPTDLSPDYLEAHIHEINQAPQKPAMDRVFGVLWLVDLGGRDTEYFIASSHSVFYRDEATSNWLPAAASSSWVRANGTYPASGQIMIEK